MDIIGIIGIFGNDSNTPSIEDKNKASITVLPCRV